MTPLLRSPPFPGVPAGTAAVSTAYRRVAEVDPARLERLVGMIRAAEVGGDFWRERPGADAREAALLDAIGRGDAAAPGLAEALLGSAYRDPFTGAPAEVEDAVATLAEWRRTIEANRGIRAAAGMAWWKRPHVARFLWSGGPLRFVRTTEQAARTGGTTAVWPSRAPAGLLASGLPLAFVEDGFVRSVGLGSDLHPPLSVVVDRSGIHYDPSRPSDLETILETADFTPDALHRAEALARFIVEAGISKYGAVGRAGPGRRSGRRRTVLVPGQVEDDMSVLLGGGGLGNRALLARVRAAEPDATILFKPHPDVDAGHRRGHLSDGDILAHADRIVRGEPMPTLLDRVDALHVLTSTAGFEALLRGVAVTTHGTPFFAGWGLTTDLGAPCPRRTRRLSLAQLAAGVLVAYPRYMDPVTGLPCSPELLLRRFAEQRRPRASWLVRARQVQGRLARAPGFRRLGA